MVCPCNGSGFELPPYCKYNITQRKHAPALSCSCKQRQVIALLSTKPLDHQAVGNGNAGKTRLVVGGGQGDVMGSVVLRPAATVFVAEETGQHFSISAEQLTQLPAVVYIGALLTDRCKGGISSLPGTFQRRVVKLFMAKNNLWLQTVFFEVPFQPLLLQRINKICSRYTVMSGCRGTLIRLVICIPFAANE